MKTFLSYLALLAHVAYGSQSSCQFGAQERRSFAYDLYANAVAEVGSESNIFLAPPTVSAALSLILAGANGTTRSQISKALNLGATQPSQGGDILCLTPIGNDASAKKGQDQSLVLRTAVSVFGEETYEFSGDYLNQTELLGSRLQKLNFSGDSDASRRIINDWVADFTEDKIKDLFPEGSIRSDTILAIASAIYFKGFWATPFDERYTKSSDFYVNENKIVQANFMSRYGDARSSYSQVLGAKLLELPYKAKGKQEVSMIIVLPDDDISMKDLEAKLREDILATAIAELFSVQPYRMDVHLPKFKLSSDYKLKPILERMGMTDMFSQHLADFSRMISSESDDNRPLFVSSAVHKTFIEMDEKGTEAAGASGLVLIAMSVPPQFICDHPFIVIIYEKQLQNILFIGKILDPTKE